MTLAGRVRSLAALGAAVAGIAAAGVAAVLMASGPGGAAAEGSVSAAAWQAYRDRFIGPEGQVIDDANRGISHSESQGYGLLLAFLAGDRATFEQIWAFTRNELLIRDDGLAAWQWEPDAQPHITDVNNASDGDILIAYSLGLAGKTWEEPRFTAAATTLATAIGENLLAEANGRTVLKPGVTGFEPADRPNRGRIVNPSYWVFEAFPVFSELAPQYPWDDLAKSGLELVAAARFGSDRLPPEWVDILPTRVAPAEGFPPVYGYNAIRIPLYLLRAGMAYGPLLEPYARLAEAGGQAVVDLATGRRTEELDEPGYRMIDAALACAAEGTAVPEDLRTFEPTQYYPSTLHLLGLAYVAERQPQCL